MKLKNLTIKILMILLAQKGLLSFKEGCLRALNEKVCVFCDFTQGYYLSPNQDCLKKTIENCVVYGLSGECYSCKEKFYFDSTVDKCIETPIKQQIENCQYYSSQNTCSSCKEGYFNSSFSCILVEKPIENCLNYISKTKCVLCQKGYIPSVSSTQCVEIKDELQGCSGYNFILCKECDQGYLMNKGYYNFSMTQGDNFSRTLFDEIGRSLVNQQKSLTTPVCQQITVSNCQSVIDYQTCKLCSENYYLDLNDKCEKYPERVVSECKKYKTLRTCLECKEGFHIDADSQCVQNSKIDNCKMYSGKFLTTKCLECEDDYYLFQDQSCIKRNTIIDGCSRLNPNFDTCLQCETGLQITNDLQKCLPVIDQCISYETSSSSSTSMKCKLCQTGWRINKDYFCIQGSEQNCEQFEFDNDECIKCKNKFYLAVGGICSPQPNIPNCEEYSRETENICTKCDNKTVLFQINKSCLNAADIQGCQIYQDAENCDLCEEGYYLQTGKCSPITEPQNCALKTGVNCTKCQQGYILHRGKCVEEMSPLTINCAQNNLAANRLPIQESQCIYCDENTLPINYKDKYSCLEKSWTQVLFLNIENCEKYEVNNFNEQTEQFEQVICKKCLENYYLDANNCVAQCSTGKVPSNYQILTESTNVYKIGSNFECFTSTVSNCKKTSPLITLSIDGPIRQGCIKCADDYQKQISVVVSLVNQLYTPINAVGIQDFNFTQNKGFNLTPVLQIPEITQCINETTPIANCEYYASQKCIKCNHGYTGKVKFQLSPFIYECVPLEFCVQKFMPGLPGILNQVISCHECEFGRVPIFYANAGSTNYIGFQGLQAYDLNETIDLWHSDTSESGVSMTCEQLTSPNLKLNILPTFPLNCAIYLRNVNNNISSADDINKQVVDKTKLALICIACLPGFKPINSVDNTNNIIPLMAYKCEEIQNCASSLWFNYCSQCAQYYAYFYKDKKVDYSQCYRFQQDENCFAVEVINTVPSCKLCKKGYKKNLDGVCEILVPDNCLNFSQETTFSLTEERTVLNLYPTYGCSYCQTGFVSVKTPWLILRCLQSIYLRSGNYPSQTQYIQNCKSFFLQNGVLKCYQCLNNYVIDSLNSKCHSQKYLLNCIVAISEQQCQKCLTTHIAIKNKCEKKNIPNCKTYEESINATSQVCSQCDSGFYKTQSGACQPGQVKYCDQYNASVDNCKTCLYGYLLIQNQTSSYCFKIDETLHCQSFDTIAFQNQQITCSQCRDESPFFLTQENISQTVCSLYNSVQTCNTHHVFPYFKDATFECTNCFSGYYSTGYQCVSRSDFQDSNCEIPELYEPQCKTCKDGFYLSTTLKCEPNPVGIQGCLIYESKTKCINCDEDMYLEKNKCIKVSQKIENCKYYQNTGQCLQCQNGFFLEGNLCPPAKAKNCKTFNSINECGSCPNRYGFKTEGDLINCVAIVDSLCIEYEMEFPFFCKKCKTDFYPSDTGVCSSTDEDFENCEFYSDFNKCMKCKKGYVLAISQTRCESGLDFTNFQDKNCQDSYLSSTPQCVICAKGMYMSQQGKCESCEHKGCHFCNPNQPIQCFICQSGYYMDGGQQCVAVKKAIIIVDDITENSKIFGILWSLFLILYQ